eukprot:553966_1
MSTRSSRNNLLVFGYVREETAQICAIPIPLIKLFEAFHDNTVSWKIPTSFKYYNSTGPQLKLQGIELQLMANRTAFWNRQHISFWIKINPHSLPLNLSTFDIYVLINGEIFNNNETEYKKENQLHFINNGNSFELTCSDNINICPWIIKNKTDMTTRFCVEIFDIKYLKMNTYCVFNWTLSN